MNVTGKHWANAILVDEERALMHKFVLKVENMAFVAPNEIVQVAAKLASLKSASIGP